MRACLLAIPSLLRRQTVLQGLLFLTTWGSEGHCSSACKDEAIQMGWMLFSGNGHVGRWNDEMVESSKHP